MSATGAKALEGKVALVTGGSSGIGLACAKRFAAEGARVVITGRRARAVDEALTAIGPAAIGFVGDVAEVAHHERLAAEVAQRFGQLDVYMANAGINTVTPSPLVGEAEYDAQFAANTRGVFFGVQKIVPVMRDGGAILITGSIASDKVLEGHAVYAGTKAATAAFARAWAIELKQRRIRVNVLSPGPVDTPILDRLGIQPGDRPDLERRMADLIPLGRLGRPSELASAALFLASDAGSFVTGVNLRVDGGISLA